MPTSTFASSFHSMHRSAALWLLLITCMMTSFTLQTGKQPGASHAITEKHYLYVATPGIRNYLDYGGHGILVYDIDNHHKLVKRIKTAGLDKEGNPSNVKGVCVSIATGCIYISTLEALQCID